MPNASMPFLAFSIQDGHILRNVTLYTKAYVDLARSFAEVRSTPLTRV
jgi:hypothetical protein